MSTKEIVAGTAYDCAGEPFEFAQIVVTDADGNIPESEVVRYFVDSFLLDCKSGLPKMVSL